MNRCFGRGRRRGLVWVAVGAAWACSPSIDEGTGDSTGAVDRPAAPQGTEVRASFDGADYSGETEMLVHGERIAGLLACNSCHLDDYSGANFGELIPLIDGLWATNISLTLPDFSDEELERLLRQGEHPTREIYLMPSKQSQFLSTRDMGALIAYLRTIEPAGEPTPLPPPGFEEAVTARLPEDYWRATLDGQPATYHNAAEEVAYFAAQAPPDLGESTAQGRLVALTMCTSCHGAALDGVGEPAGDIQSVLEYDDLQFRRLLRDGVDRSGRTIDLPWGEGHASLLLTDGEIGAAISYTRLLAERREGAE